jgi:hypothetical protein
MADTGDAPADALIVPGDSLAADDSTEDEASPAAENSVPGTGCMDGTREGFRDDQLWPSIAGCAGEFTRPGVIQPLPRVCTASDDGGAGDAASAACSAADLCAVGWHVCRDGAEVAASSPAGCEGCVNAGEESFFLAAMGASPLGYCIADPTAANGLHGCGGMGEPENPECAPLTRRMSFADCLATQGVWNCGTADGADMGDEANVVTKYGPTMGGVLCCKD